MNRKLGLGLRHFLDALSMTMLAPPLDSARRLLVLLVGDDVVLVADKVLVLDVGELPLNVVDILAALFHRVDQSRHCLCIPA